MDDLHRHGPDGIVRSLDEHYDTMMDVEQDPTGAFMAIQAQAARIAELEAETVKTRGYRVGHIAGFHAGIRQAAKRYREGDDWDVFATADCAILDLINKDTSHDG